MMRLLTAFTFLFLGVDAQVGILCACQPSLYRFELDFSLSCANTSFIVGNGIDDTSCIENGRDQPNEENLNFSAVELIQVFEMDQNLRPLPNQTNLLGNFLDGFSFTYSSFTATSTLFNVTSVPRAIQVNLLGNNTENRRIQSSWSVFFTNDCFAFPVIQPIQSSAITLITDVADPPQALCPLAPGTPTTFPTTASPSTSPTPEPIVGTDVCGCQPGGWDFTLALQSSCKDNTFGPPGVVDSACIATGVPSNIVEDLELVAVEFVTIIELNKFQVAVNQRQYLGPFFQNNTISYTSLLSTAETLNSTTLPVGLQMILTGQNKLGQTVRISWGLEFSESCDIFPIATASDTIGPANVTAVSAPPERFCPLATDVPTFFPSSSPVDLTNSPSPESAPTQTPTSTPSLPTGTPRPSVDLTNSPSPEVAPSQTPTSTPSLPTGTPRPSVGLTNSPSPEVAPSQTPTSTPSLPTGTPRPSVDLTNSPSPEAEPTQTPSSIPSLPTGTPRPSNRITFPPTPKPTSKPTRKPRPKPTQKPTNKPVEPCPPYVASEGKKYSKSDSGKKEKYDSGKKEKHNIWGKKQLYGGWMNIDDVEHKLIKEKDLLTGDHGRERNVRKRNSKYCPGPNQMSKYNDDHNGPYLRR